MNLINNADEILDKIVIIASSLKNSLGKLGWDNNDIGLTIFANGVGMLANIKSIASDQIHGILLLIEEKVRSIVPSFRLNKRLTI